MIKDNLIQKPLNSQPDAVIHFLQKMDVEMVNDILDDNKTYQDFEKPIFIHKLGDAIDKFIEGGDTFLKCDTGLCNAKTCNYKCTGFSFIGNNSGNYMDLIIEIKEGIVHDMYECAEFRNATSTIVKMKRIRIHNFEIGRLPF